MADCNFWLTMSKRCGEKGVYLLCDGRIVRCAAHAEEIQENVPASILGAVLKIRTQK